MIHLSLTAFAMKWALAARRFARDASGATALTFAVAAPALIGAAGADLDYSNLQAQKVKMQSVADGAALAAARELRLGNSNNTTATNVAQNYVNAGALGASARFSSSIASDNSSITVNLSEVVQTYVMKYVNTPSATLHVSATAKVVGGQPICVIGLDASANFTVGLTQSAKLNAPGCSVYSNSTKPNGLFAKNAAVMTAAFICSGGGKAGAGPGSFAPAPLTDCPLMPDPLGARPAPPYSGCSFNNLVVTGGMTTLYPGVYCGGLTLTSAAKVTLASGVYIFQNGPLYVTGGSTLQGSNVGLFFTGSGAVVNFDTLSTINLTAPASGPLAGLLIYEDRASPAGQTHQIMSDNARNLLGTIYLPRGMLHVGANSPVADQSAYTIVVANQFSLSAGPTMVLNTNYSSTNIPVPDNLGPNAAKAFLTK